jgi:predicted regulator of Ras-like GTPase activity (Roadblock/LC7/MglB family)
MSVEEEVTEILQSLKKIKGIHGSAILERFGVITGSALPGWVDADSVAAMVTLILKASERATKELNQGSFLNAIIENERGKLLFAAIGTKIIVVITTVDAKLGILDLKLKTARQKLTGAGTN